MYGARGRKDKPHNRCPVLIITVFITNSNGAAVFSPLAVSQVSLSTLINKSVIDLKGFALHRMSSDCIVERIFLQILSIYLSINNKYKQPVPMIVLSKWSCERKHVGVDAWWRNMRLFVAVFVGNSAVRGWRRWRVALRDSILLNALMIGPLYLLLHYFYIRPSFRLFFL